MAVKIKNSGLYISKLNGKQLVNNQYALDIDSSRQKKKQVLGMFKNNGVVETMHDSFQNYMNKTSSKNQSIFDLLKNERNEISKLPNIVMKIADTSPIMPTPSPTSSLKKMIMKQKTRKLANSNNGISSKLFDFTNIEQAPNPNPYPNPYPKSKLKSKLKNIYQTRKRQRKRTSRRNRKRF